MMKKIITLILSVFLLTNAHAGKIKKGMAALDIYNYFKAKSLFEKAEKKQPVAAKYGLSIIYQRTDNPFSNLDSALNKIVYACDNYRALKSKKKEKYKKYGIDSVRIYRQRDVISELYFKRALSVNSIYGYQDFIDKNPWSKAIQKAEYLRDSLYYEEVSQKGSALDYGNFINQYPNSVFANRATENYNRSLYLEKTKDKSLLSYITFVKNYPNSPYKSQAEDEIFRIATITKTKEAYANFINDYPDNKNIHKAWMYLYEATLQSGYSEEGMKHFLAEYPDFPFKTKLLNELKLESVKFLKIKENDKWGFISENGQYKIECIYDYVEDFNEGLAVVSKNGKVGYISKTGETKIEHKFSDGFDFFNGAAVVEINEKMGLINRNGNYILEPIYNDVGMLSNGLSFFETEKGFGYADNKGYVRLPDDYTDAADFVNGKAIVSRNNNYGVIDEFGTTYIPFMYESIKAITVNCFAVRLNNKWGVLNLKKDTVLQIKYDYIGVSDSNFIMLTINDSVNYFDLNHKKIISATWFTTYPEYKIMGKFNNGYAKVKQANGFNFIDEKGALLFKNSFENLGFYNNYIAFEKKDKWGYIDKSANVVVKPSYDKAYSFKKVGGVVEKTPLRGIVNIKGEEVIGVFYEDFYFVNDSLLIAKSNGRYGLLNIQGDTLIQITNKLIEPYSNTIVLVITTGDVRYFNIETQKWIRKEE